MRGNSLSVLNNWELERDLGALNSHFLGTGGEQRANFRFSLKGS